VAKRPAPAKPASSEKATAEEATSEQATYVRRHLAFGWWSLAAFALLGLVLESAHGLKLGWYLDLSNTTRRLSLTLGHAHGTLLGLVNLAFALSLQHTKMSATALGRASFALRAATILMPLGFILGGLKVYAGDPGIGIVLVPPSAVLLIIGLVSVARGFSSRR
jgi:hypothetical protein